MPTPEEQQEWLRLYPTGNIGLPFGPASGLVGIDIDTEDKGLEAVIEETVGFSPWRRIGQKGSLLIFRYMDGQKIVRLKTAAGESLVEILSTGSQAVLPPSIHPKTQRPYTANCELFDVLSRIHPLDPQVERRLRAAITGFGIEVGSSGFGKTIDWVSVGSRDTKMTQYAGLLAASVRKGEIPLLEAFNHLEAWFDNHVQSVAGDDVDVGKGKLKICEFLSRDVMGERRLPLAQGWDEGMTSEQKEELNLDFGKDVEEWDFERHTQYLQEMFEKHDQNTTGRQMAIRKSLDRIVASPNMSHLERGQVLRYIANANRSIAISDLKGQINEMTRGDVAGEDHTELAEAVIDVMRPYGEVRFWSDRFWRWGGSHWTPLHEHEIMKVIAENFGSGYNASRRHSDHKGILKIMAAMVSGQLKDENADVAGINFANGFLTPDLELTEHSPRYGMTYTLPFRYLPDQAGMAFRFQQYLYDSWGQDSDYVEKVNALQEIICATLFNLGTRFQKAALLHGAPKSGKSVMLEIISSLVPDDARSAVAPSDWGDRFLPEMMSGCVLNIAGELSEHKFIDSDAFKSIVVGEVITVQRKNGQPYQMHPTCTHWFASNHLPRTKDTSSAFNRRWLILTFNRPVDDDKKDTELAQKIVKEEREALVAWAAQAMPRLLEKGSYTEPHSHTMMLREVATNNNIVRWFLVEGGAVNITGNTSKLIDEESLYNLFYATAIGPAAGTKPVARKTFRATMRELAAEFDFDLIENETENGGKEVNYAGLEVRK